MSSEDKKEVIKSFWQDNFVKYGIASFGAWGAMFLFKGFIVTGINAMFKGYGQQFFDACGAIFPLLGIALFFISGKNAYDYIKEFRNGKP